MPRLIAFASLACGLLVSVSASAESVRIHTSTSTHVTSDENETVTRTTEETSESKHSGSFRSVTCITTNGVKKCTEYSGGNSASAASDRPTARVLNDAHSSASNMTHGELFGRLQSRIAQRVCRRVHIDERDACLKSMQEGTIFTMRERLRLWLKAHS